MVTWFSLYILIINVHTDQHHMAYHPRFSTEQACQRYAQTMKAEIEQIPGQQAVHILCLRKTQSR